MVTEKEFNTGIRKLTRFLKERGQYKYVLRFLFYGGRKKENLYYEFNNHRYRENGYKWKDLFNYISLVGEKGYIELWEEYRNEINNNIKPAWEKYCSENDLV